MKPGTQWMIDAFRGEERRPSVVIVLSTALVVSWWYLSHSLPAAVPPELSGWGEKWISRDLLADLWGGFRVLGLGALLLGLVPLIVVKAIFRERLRDYGVRLGDVKVLAFQVSCMLPLFILLGYWAAHRPDYQQAYPLNDRARDCFGLHVAFQIAYYLGWEFHFRGFVLQGVRPRAGEHVAMWVETIASTLAHLGKPLSETLGALLGGFFWGAITLRSRSILASFLQHWLLGLTLDITVCYWLGL
ncbi:MAG TPA: CPBP family intramembrane glutamic endopeptidase [Pirellulales bacterium]|jgi:membrane protease YdiL (CAAX protease family)|nr:CPBP family intramembrane glutamic endopeptidase [Pirellulales bacterium]